MVRVTLNDLSRVPVERLARLLLEWAANDQSLLGRLHATLSHDPSVSQQRLGQASLRTDFVGRSPSMRAVIAMSMRYALTDEPVLITGESGTGKELVARAIHQNSKRHTGRFVAVNCAAIPSSLVASELFGYEKGAFTGAAVRTKGQIEHADGGTLFLDEIGDMPVDLQGHLLRFLQEGQIVRVGGREAVNVNVRVVSATNVRLLKAIVDGRFREDLYYRLNILTLALPPLRERPDDIEPLARHFLRQAAADFGREATDISADAIAALRQCNWPGNVRELMSVIRRTVVIGSNPVITAADLVGLPDVGTTPVVAAITSRPNPGSEAERRALLAVLDQTQENVTETARALGVSRVTLYRMLHRNSIALSRGFKPPLGWTERQATTAAPPTGPQAD